MRAWTILRTVFLAMTMLVGLAGLSPAQAAAPGVGPYALLMRHGGGGPLQLSGRSLPDGLAFAPAPRVPVALTFPAAQRKPRVPVALALVPAAPPKPIALESPKPRVAMPTPRPRVPAMWSAPFATAAKPTTSQNLGRPFFDQERHGLAIPYQGSAPRYRVTSQGSTRAVLELEGRAEQPGRLVQSFRHNPLMASWQFQKEDSAGHVKVAIAFHHPATLVIAADPLRHRLLAIPQPRLPNEAKAANGRAVLTAARLPNDGRHLILPFSGPVPAVSVARVDGNFAYVDFPDARLASHGVQFLDPAYHPTLNYGMLSERPGGGVRLSLALTQAGSAVVYQDRGHQQLVVDLGAGPVGTLGAFSSAVPAEWPSGVLLGEGLR